MVALPNTSKTVAPPLDSTERRARRSVSEATLVSTIKVLDTEIADLKRILKRTEGLGENYPINYKGKIYTVSTLTALLTKKLSTRTVLQVQLLKKRTDKKPVNNGTTGDGGGGGAAAPAPKPGPIKYNIPGALDIYLQGKDWQSSFIAGGISNVPSFVFISEWQEMWSSNKGVKGRIQTWTPPEDWEGAESTFADNTILTQAQVRQPYAFQFMYNPTSVTLSYEAGGAFDIGFVTSGSDKSTPMTGNATLTFQVILNRMPDIVALKKGMAASDIYGAGANVSAADLTKIQDKGTMYDLDYLFYACVGWEMKTQLRGTTPDFGVLLGQRVEIHLGKPIRYTAIVNSIEVNHVIFDDRMVPMFTNLSVSASIVPDPNGVWADNGAGGSSNSGKTFKNTLTVNNDGTLSNPNVRNGKNAL